MRVQALGDLRRLRVFRIGALVVVATVCLARALVWSRDLDGALRDALLVLPVIAWAPWAARLYRRCLLDRLRTGRAKVVRAARRCSNSADEDPAETDPRAARRCRDPGAGGNHCRAAVRGPE
ncbi:MAG: hypothetical protein JSV45_06530 [Chromatiales bacterium]|nr:MAG: hypothetical protein JSV45_06530 [Chromatiales bacterium]